MNRPGFSRESGSFCRLANSWRIDRNKELFDPKTKEFGSPSKSLYWNDGSRWRTTGFERANDHLPLATARTISAPSPHNVLGPLQPFGLSLSNGQLNDPVAPGLSKMTVASVKALKQDKVAIVFEIVDRSNKINYEMTFDAAPPWRIHKFEARGGSPNASALSPMKGWETTEFGTRDGVWYPVRVRLFEQGVKESGSIEIKSFSLTPSLDLSKEKSYETNPDVTFHDESTGFRRASRKENERMRVRAAQAVEEAKTFSATTAENVRRVDAHPNSSSWLVGTTGGAALATLVIGVYFKYRQRAAS